MTRKRRQMKRPTAQHGEACMERDIIVAMVLIFIITLYWKRDSAKRDSAKRDSAKRDSVTRDSAKRDSAKRDSAKREDTITYTVLYCTLSHKLQTRNEIPNLELFHLIDQLTMKEETK